VSMVNGSPQYATANAFRRALEDRLKQEARLRGRPLEELRREFLFQRFLALLFSGPEGRWVIKGGASLLMRLADARSSKDLDLLHLGEVEPEEAIAELREFTAPREGDYLTFVIGEGVSYSRANPVVEISVTSYIGALYGRFPIDLATELHLRATPERIRPTPVVDLPGLAELPEVVVYPLTDRWPTRCVRCTSSMAIVRAPRLDIATLSTSPLSCRRANSRRSRSRGPSSRRAHDGKCNCPLRWSRRRRTGQRAIGPTRVRPGSTGRFTTWRPRSSMWAVA